ncbi:hypothetical protein AJ80_01185 [Polytolypa hystricis UAMH7299]|uniref:Uncharacterized protein n=1 Tax=Polytolypa hystricis (strain UAMH7299) TaxID=1447883 RepID=A0A2B7Z278_POLH7|nr:hypothetical protein AJ80_01185 [Polytolypa hystricis UAMH7299]
MSPNPISLSFDEVDDLIYDARSGDLESLRTDITALSEKHSCSPSDIIQSAIDSDDESEGGTCACLLHWPAANGNIEILNYLLSIIAPQDTKAADSTPPSTSSAPSSLLNHRNLSGNTPLHWAALNTHLDCVKALVEAGADITLTNSAGHDATFLAERSDWNARSEEEIGKAEEEQQQQQQEGESEVAIGGDDGESEPLKPLSKALQVVEYLLGCEKGAELESGFGAAGSGAGEGSAQDGNKMEGVEGEVK